MKVTVIIPTRNRAPLLRDALISVQAQSLQAFQVIVSDNGSSDDTREVLRAHGSTLETVCVMEPGKSRALNAALARVRGDAILVLDDDDVLPRRALELHVAALRHAPAATFSFGRYQRFRGAIPNQPKCDWRDEDIEPIPADDRRRTLIKLMERCFLPNPAWMVRTCAMRAAGHYDEEALRSQDYDMIMRLSRTNDGAFVDDIVLFQRQHGGERRGVVLTTGGQDVFAAWDHHDRRIFRKLAASWPIEDFRPLDDEVSLNRSERTCRMQKGAILFAQACYEEAFAELRQHRELMADTEPFPIERAIAARFMIRHFPSGGKVDASALAGNLRGLGWPAPLRTAFVQGARWQVRDALVRADLQGALMVMRLLYSSCGPLAVTAGLPSHALRPWAARASPHAA